MLHTPSMHPSILSMTEKRQKISNKIGRLKADFRHNTKTTKDFNVYNTHTVYLNCIRYVRYKYH